MKSLFIFFPSIFHLERKKRDDFEGCLKDVDGCAFKSNFWNFVRKFKIVSLVEFNLLMLQSSYSYIR